MSFAHFNVETQIFFKTALSQALVNVKPILPGHVLVTPQRVVPRLHDLTDAETTDLFHTVKKVVTVLEGVYNAEGSTVSMQDGPVAGQSVPHLHFHILPRTRGDYTENDEIYNDLNRETYEMSRTWYTALLSRQQIHVDEGARRSRTLEEMEREAKWLKSFF